MDSNVAEQALNSKQLSRYSILVCLSILVSGKSMRKYGYHIKPLVIKLSGINPLPFQSPSTASRLKTTHTMQKSNNNYAVGSWTFAFSRFIHTFERIVSPSNKTSINFALPFIFPRDESLRLKLFVKLIYKHSLFKH